VVAPLEETAFSIALYLSYLLEAGFKVKSNPKMKDKRESIEQRLKAVPWSLPISNVLSELAECIKIDFKHFSETNYLSKIGGSPDMEAGAEWPLETAIKKSWKPFMGSSEEVIHRPFSFIAQIDLDEIAQLNLAENFPTSGMLYFFYCQDQSSLGDKEMDDGKWQVIHQDIPKNKLYPIRPPEDLPPASQFKEQRVELSLGYTLSYFGDFRSSLSLTDNENSLLTDIVEGDYVNQILGPSHDLIQNQIYHLPFITEDLEDFNEITSDWLLLLQIDSIEECGMNWGDLGVLYFWISVEDLQTSRFDRVWCTLQSY
jgi:uncharacterized protein YwqG